MGMRWGEGAENKSFVQGWPGCFREPLQKAPGVSCAVHPVDQGYSLTGRPGLFCVLFSALNTIYVLTFSAPNARISIEELPDAAVYFRRYDFVEIPRI